MQNEMFVSAQVVKIYYNQQSPYLKLIQYHIINEQPRQTKNICLLIHRQGNSIAVSIASLELSHDSLLLFCEMEKISFKFILNVGALVATRLTGMIR
jgi:hypothetical protein